MTRLPVPNHTQTPNLFFDEILPQVKSLAELKILLVIMRQTFGWHRPTDKLSLSQIETLTGLSRQSVVVGIESGIEHGWIERQAAGRSWRYSLALITDYYEMPTLGEIVKNLDSHSQESRPKLVKNLDSLNKERKVERNTVGAQGAATPRSSPVPPQIELVRELTRRYPPKELWSRIIQTLGQNPAKHRLTQCWEEWRLRGFKPTNFHWLTEWYVRGIPPSNGHHLPTQAEMNAGGRGKLVL